MKETTVKEGGSIDTPICVRTQQKRGNGNEMVCDVSVNGESAPVPSQVHHNLLSQCSIVGATYIHDRK